jgi:hypothetical protein
VSALAVTLVASGSAAGPGELAAQPSGPGTFPVHPDLPPESRQFDFWVGEWDVNLRILQDDGSWQDAVGSTAHVYPILSGKAVLELWSDDRQAGIKGYSLRYWNVSEAHWDLWLNWPGMNRSATGSPLTGTFRHGRGEFFARGRAADGSTRATRYTFSDVSPTSLRWDDAVSTDGGRTWSANWIMEFTRTAAKPALPPGGGPALTWHDGSRCDDPHFRAYEFLSGRHENAAAEDGPYAITGYEILDGCALITFVAAGDGPESAWGFSHITWNAAAGGYELATLTSVPNATMQVFHADEPTTPGEFVFVEAAVPGTPFGASSSAREQMRVTHESDGTIIWAHLAADGAVIWEGRVR